MKKHYVLGLTGRQRGYTLRDLLITMVIASILVAVATPMYGDNGPDCDNTDSRQGPLMRAKIGKVTVDIGLIHIEATKFVLSNNRYPDDLAEIGLDGLEDPWGNPYQYLLVEGLGNDGAVRKDHDLKPVNSYFDVYSMGPDGDTASPFTSNLGKDDIVMANDGSYFGLACQYDGSEKRA
jgi:general secretion pathway protein G